MRKDPKFYPLARVICRFIFKVIYPCDIQNSKSLPDDKRMIVCSNHVHNIDPVLINYSQNRLVHFMAKKELFNNKLFAKLITSLGAFPVNRGNDGGKAIGVAEDLLRDENCVGIFIEGRRSKSGQLGRPHIGAFLIAFATDSPILPCCITPKKGFIKPFRKTKVTYGEPITCEELGIREGTNQELRAAASKVMGIISEMREKHIEEFNSKR